MSGRKATTDIVPGRLALSVGKPSKAIPSGWRWVLLLDVAKLATGHTPSRKVSEYWGGDIPWMSVGDARKRNGKKIFETKQCTNSLGIANSAAVLLPENTVCLSRTASIGYVIMLGKPMATSQGFVNWICSEQLNPRYLQLLLLSENQFLYEISEGTAHTTIYYPEVKAFNISMPVRSEQDRIVAKSDTLMAQIETMQKSLKRIPQLLKDFRQQVLTQAVTGKLTEEWREGKELEEWETSSIGKLFDVKTGATPKRGNPIYFENGNIPWLKSGQVKNEYIYAAEEFITETAIQETNAKLYPIDTLLVAMYGEGKTRGQVGWMKIEAASNQAIAALVNETMKLETKQYVYYYCLSQYNEIRAKAEGGNQPNLSLSKIKSWEISLPTFEEQIEIVRSVEGLFAKADVIEEKYNALKTKIDMLPQAILHKAFKGELVERLPTEGDAKDLLREIEGLRKANKGK